MKKETLSVCRRTARNIGPGVSCVGYQNASIRFLCFGDCSEESYETLRLNTIVRIYEQYFSGTAIAVLEAYPSPDCSESLKQPLRLSTTSLSSHFLPSALVPLFYARPIMGKPQLRTISTDHPNFALACNEDRIDERNDFIW